LRDDASPDFTLESTGSSDGGAVVVCPNVNEPFVAVVVAEVVAGVTVDGTSDADPVVTAEGFVLVGMLAVICLFAVFDGVGWPEDESSGRRRFSGCDS
jgi:hypothetical protein